MLRRLLPLCALVLAYAGGASSARGASGGPPPSVIVLDLECIAAAPDGLPVRIEADAGGPAVVLTPYLRHTPRSAGVGALVPSRAAGGLALQGDRLSGSVRATIPLPAAKERDKRSPHEVDLTLAGTVGPGGVVEGRWTSPGGAAGRVVGFRRELPDPGTCDSGALLLVTPWPVSGRVLDVGLGGAQARLGASFTLDSGSIRGGAIFPGRIKSSYYPASTYQPATWITAAGHRLAFSGAGAGSASKAGEGEGGDQPKDVSVTGSVTGSAMDLTLAATWRGKPVKWVCRLERAGALWHGRWTWAVDGFPEAGSVAVARLARAPSPPAVPPVSGAPSGKTPEAVLLRHALALVAHPSFAGWHDDLLASALLGTGDKQYDNGANSVAGAITTALLIARLSPDPLQRAEALAMARRATYWWRLAGGGPYKVASYYKGMFWVNAWAALAFADLAAFDPEGPWKAQTAALAATIADTQLPSGAWSWVDEETGTIGHSNERNDRSADNRELNSGDLALALRRAGARAGIDTSAAHAKAVAWLAAQIDKPSPWFFLDRRPGESKDALPTVAWLQTLVEQPEPNLALIGKVRAAIDREHLGDGRVLLDGYFPRAAPGDPGSAPDLSSSARYAHALARLAANGDAGARVRANALIAAILAKADPESAIIDHYGRALPSAPSGLGKEDSHSYLCLKAAVAWEVLEALQLLGPGKR